MKIEWTTIESGKKLTKTKIDNILKSKNKFSKFFGENKKHLLGAGVSTMAMGFVLISGQMSGAKFSADIMFPSLSNEIENANSLENDLSLTEDLSFNDDASEPLEFDDNSGELDNVGNLLGDLDLINDSISSDESVSNETANSVDPSASETDDSVDLVNNLFGIEPQEEEVKNDKKEKNNASEGSQLLSFLESENITEGSFKTKEDNSELEENFHNSAVEEIEKDKVSERDFKKDSIKNIGEVSKNAIFKQNFHTVDMNLVENKAKLKDIPEEKILSMEDFHGSADLSLKNDNLDQSFMNQKEYLKEDISTDLFHGSAVKNTKRLSSSGPGDMIFGLGFLSMILAYFFRRKRV